MNAANFLMFFLYIFHIFPFLPPLLLIPPVYFCFQRVRPLPLSHLEMVSSWFMDFSMNLGKTSVFKYQPLSFVFPKSTNKSFMAFPHQGTSYSHDPDFS